jgi:hypothetical protein
MLTKKFGLMIQQVEFHRKLKIVGNQTVGVESEIKWKIVDGFIFTH